MGELAGADFRTGTPAAVWASVHGYGAAMTLDPTYQVAFGLGVLRPSWRYGSADAAHPVATVDAASFGEFREALARGDAWSEALRRLWASDRMGAPTLPRLTYYDETTNEADLSARGFRPLGPLEGWTEDDDGKWFVFFVKGRAAQLENVQKLEEYARLELSTREPDAVRAIRNEAAARGAPLTLADAREAYARSAGISATEAQTLRDPTMPTLPTDPSARASLILRGVPAAHIVGASRDAGFPVRTARAGASPGSGAPSEALASMSSFPVAKVGVGLAGGALAGALLGRLLTGSFGGGAALGGAIGAAAGGGVGYALGT